MAVYGRRTRNNGVKLKQDILGIRRCLVTVRMVEPRLPLAVMQSPFPTGCFQDLMGKALGILV